MAKTSLSQANFVERGYGQVEPNHLSAQRTGQIYAQLPAVADITVLENGQFVKYNPKAGVVDFAGAGEWMLVFNEVKVYEDHEGDQDFAMVKDAYLGGTIVPRVFKTNVGDMYTTNCVNLEGEPSLGDVLTPDATNGILKVGTGDMEWEIVKIYTLPDRQKAVKVMRIK